MSSDQETGTTLRLLYAAEGGVRSIFSERTTDYAASRPDYPAALFEVLKMNCAPNKDAVVADIGAGTGHLTQGLLKSGYRVVGVEPNAEMRDVSDFRLGEIAGYSSINGCAESIPLESASIDLITAAQAFHWFEVERARIEFLRVLTARGQAALIWNDRVLEDPLHVALDEVFSRFGGAKRAALVAHEDRSDVPRLFGSTQPKQFSWPHEHYLNRRWRGQFRYRGSRRRSAVAQLSTLAITMPPSLITPEFEKHARRLNDLTFSETAQPFYEMMSGGLMWEDEKPDVPFSELGWFRAALAYRTSVILGQPRSEFESVWSGLQRIAPKWPGFRSDRCTPSPELVDYLTKQKKSSGRSLDRLDAAASGRWKPLSGGRDG